MPLKNPPTIYDVADAAEVSITTVSRVLNGASNVNDETRKRIFATIDQIGFVPKAEARARALRDSGRIGVLSPFFTAPAFVQRLRGISSALTSLQELIIYSIDNTRQLDSYLSTLPIMGNLDGLIILSLQITPQDIQRLQEHHLNTVLVEYPVAEFSGVTINNYEGGRLAADHLISRGHQKFAFIGSDQTLDFSLQPIEPRRRGYQDRLTEFGFELDENSILRAPYNMEETLTLTRQFLSSQQTPLAIFASTDLQAMATVKIARELGLQVPQELAIIGFDDIDMASFTGLTTIRQHLDESGRIAVELLMTDRQDQTRLPRHVELPLQVIQRETT